MGTRALVPNELEAGEKSAVDAPSPSCETNYDDIKGHDERREGQEDDKTIAPDWFMVNLIERRL